MSGSAVGLGGSVRRTFIRHPILRQIFALPLAARTAVLSRRYKEASKISERLQTILGDDILIKVAEFNGTFHCSPKSHLFTRMVQFGYYEPQLAELFLSHLDFAKDVIDVGANIGFYTVGAAQCLNGGKVLAIEPTDGAFERLEKNIALNGVADKVILFKGLASDKSGESEMHSIPGMEEYSSIAPLVHSSVTEIETHKSVVASSTIDDLVKTHNLNPALIKVDVEGAEGLVFGGATETLRKYRPVVLSELSDELLESFGSKSSVIIEMFRDLGYKVIDPVDPAIDPGLRRYGDILCLPK